MIFALVLAVSQQLSGADADWFDISRGVDRFAVEELKRHVEALGTRVPEGFVWHLGKAPEGKSADGLSPEEGRYLVDDKGAWFWGEGANGARFAMLEYLDRHCGVRWPWGDEIVCPPGNGLPKAEGRIVPTVKIRTFRPHSWVKLWHQRQLLGGHDKPKYGHAYTKYWDRFSLTHPEFFAMRRDGRRLPSDAKPDMLNAAAYVGRKGETISMCVSAEGLVRQTIEDWLAAGTNEYVNVCENDASGDNVCHCPQCLKLDEPPPPDMDPKWQTCYADRYVDFGNRVLAEARKFRPDAKVCFYAYNATQDPPRRVKPADGLVLGVVPVDFRWTSVTNYVSGWKRAGLKNFFCRPNRHCYYECPYIPLGSEKHFFRLWQFLHEQGCIGLDDSAAKYRSRTEWLGDYTIYQAMRDPSKDYDFWERHYCSAFGAAAEEVRAYFRFWREELWEKRLEPNLDKIMEKGRCFNVGRGVMWSFADYYHPEDYAKAGAILERALARDLDAVSRRLVEELRLSHEHAVLFYNAVTLHNRQTKLPREKKDFSAAQALKAFRERHGIALVPWNEGYYGDVTDLMALTGLPRPKKND